MFRCSLILTLSLGCFLVLQCSSTPVLKEVKGLQKTDYVITEVHPLGNPFIYLIQFQTDATIQQIPLSAGDIAGVYCQHGTLHNVTLSKETFILDQVFATGTQVTFYPNKDVRSVLLVEDMTIQDIPFKANSELHFSSHQAPSLEAPAKTLYFPEEAGRVIFASLSEPHWINDRHCYHEVSFYSNGALRSAYLKEPLQIGKLSIEPSNYILWDKDGTVAQVVFAHPCSERDMITFVDVTCRCNSSVYFYPSGQLQSCFLGEDYSKDGESYSAGGFIIFDEEGHVQNYDEE